MIQVDLRQERFLKVWRVSGDSVEATAAVIRQRHGGFSAAIHYVTPHGRTRTWRWPAKNRPLSGRELVQSVFSIERGFKSIPGMHVRVDFPVDSNHADQVVLLMEYGLVDLVSEENVTPDLTEGCTS